MSEKTIADRVKEYNDKLKGVKAPAKVETVQAPEITHKSDNTVYLGTAISTWLDTATQQWYYVEVEFNPLTKQANVKTLEHKISGKPEARETFKMQAARLGLV